MEPADHAVEARFAKAGPGVLEHVDHSGVRARGEHDHALAGDVHRDEALVHDQLVELPAGAIECLAVLSLETAFEARHARDFAADVSHPVEHELRLGRVDHVRAVRASAPQRSGRLP